jgi:hypothetical protein
MFVNTFFENFTRNREQRNRSIISNYVFILFIVDRGDVANFHLFGKCLVIRLMLKIAHNGLEIISYATFSSLA